MEVTTYKVNDELSKIKVELATHREQIVNICKLCAKMDSVIERMDTRHQAYVEKIERELSKQQDNSDDDLASLSKKIDKLIAEFNEYKIESIKSRENDIKELREEIDALKQWRWMIAGSMTVIVWILTKLDVLSLFKKILI